MAIEYIKISAGDITTFTTALATDLKSHYLSLQTVASARATAGLSPALESDWIVDGADNTETGGHGIVTGLASVLSDNLVNNLLKKGYIDDDVS